jgi:hypothetical protein
MLDLERGTVAATIFAAPRVFALGTPGGIAVDLGCIYETTVADDGATRLKVTSGRVSFESDGRKVHVPAGAGCRAWPGYGPGTPTWSDGDPALSAAVERHDEARARGDAAAAANELGAVLLLIGAGVGGEASPGLRSARDTLPLWHLLATPESELRIRVFERLARFSPPPEGVRCEHCIVLEDDRLAAWREELERHW